MRNIPRRAILLAALLAFHPACFAAASAPAAAQTQAASGGAHAEHATHGVMANSSMGGGTGKPASWTAFPTLKTRASGETRARRIMVAVPQNIAVDGIDAYSNNLGDARGRRRLPLEMAGAKLDKPENGGFHWLAAREEQGGHIKVASTVQFFSERGAQNPTAMFMQQKHELEIIPQPFPREHSRYRANEDWKFLVRFNGKPLAGHKVLLETANGTKAELASDAQGAITVRIPDDFKDEPRQGAAGGHNHGRRGSDFVLAAEHVEGGKTYLTAFNAGYGTDAYYQRSLAMGLGFTLLGMIGAAPLLRQRKNAKPVNETVNDKEV